MFSNISIFSYAAGGIFGLIILLSILGSMLEKSDSPSLAGWRALFERSSGTIFGTLFFLLCFAIIPAFLRLFTTLQVKIGNAEHPLVRFLQQHECHVTYALWGIMVVFVVVMLPTIIADMKGS